MAGVVTPLTPGVPQSSQSDVQCAVDFNEKVAMFNVYK